MEKLTLKKFRAIIKVAKHQVALNFHKKSEDADFRIFNNLSGKYSNVFQMSGEFMLVTENGNEYFVKNKYAK